MKVLLLSVSRICMFAAACLVSIASTQAAEVCKGPGLKLSTEANYVYLQGNLCENDGNKFIQYMATTGKGLSIARLNLTGGAGVEAVKIGRYLRSHGMTTWTDGKQDKCASACNRVFAGGLHRIYSHANYIQTGKNPNQKLGLGYHHPNSNGDFDGAEKFYQKVIMPYLQEMLPAEGYRWVVDTDEKNRTFNMVWLNGKQALELGIATSEKSNH